ncbi:MAG: hypothetical protein H6978_01560 [Gammaproteobacteria bacterium]|nr:hypothetical protein [Gammaproteobacteria bacterium]
MRGSGSGGLLREAVSHAGRVAALLCMLQATTVWPAGIAYSAEMPQAAAGGADTPGPAADDDLELVVRACAVCHPIELVISQPRTDDEWDELILRMVDHGAVANDDEQWRILEYFLRHYARDND